MEAKGDQLRSLVAGDMDLLEFEEDTELGELVDYEEETFQPAGDQEMEEHEKQGSERFEAWDWIHSPIHEGALAPSLTFSDSPSCTNQTYCKQRVPFLQWLASSPQWQKTG